MLRATRNWSKMTSDILYMIYSKLPPDLHFHHLFRSASSAWYSLVASSDTRNIFPWLIKCENSSFVSATISEEQALIFYSILAEKTLKTCLPTPLCGKVHNGTNHGNLLVESQAGDFFIFNPISSQQVRLPRIEQNLWIQFLVSCLGTEKDSPAHVIVCRIPAVADSGGWIVLVYCQQSWINITVPEEICATACTTCQWREWICATQEGLLTGLFDIRSGALTHVIEPPAVENPAYSSYIVESCGDLLRVSRYFHNGGSPDIDSCRFMIYKLSEDEDGKRFSWTEVSALGGRVIFLDSWATGFSTAAPSGINGNCIYFIVGDGILDLVGRYDIGTSTVERVACPLTQCSWFKPRLS